VHAYWTRSKWPGQHALLGIHRLLRRCGKLKCERRSERQLISIYRSIPSYNRFVARHLVRSRYLAYRVQDRSSKLRRLGAG
jgi:hypothetical protein